MCHKVVNEIPITVSYPLSHMCPVKGLIYIYIYNTKKKYCVSNMFEKESLIDSSKIKLRDIGIHTYLQNKQISDKACPGI